MAFMFTQVGVIVLIASYMVGGAFVFQHIEQDSLMEQAVTAQDVSSHSHGYILFSNQGEKH